jgi:hypothetical protein
MSGAKVLSHADNCELFAAVPGNLHTQNQSNHHRFSQPDQINDDMTLPSLPCFPCPHAASCCAYGTTVSDEEAAAIEANHGAGLVYKTWWGEWRTRVRKRRCALFRDGGCSIHDRPYYPATCRSFPWTDTDGDRYEYDVTICGAFAENPELVAIQRALPSSLRIKTVARDIGS